jgi:hypothetical protein
MSLPVTRKTLGSQQALSKYLCFRHESDDTNIKCILPLNRRVCILGPSGQKEGKIQLPFENYSTNVSLGTTIPTRLYMPLIPVAGAVGLRT